MTDQRKKQPAVNMIKNDQNDESDNFDQRPTPAKTDRTESKTKDCLNQT